MALHLENFCGSLEEESYLLKRAKKNWLTFEGASRWRSNSFSPGVSFVLPHQKGGGCGYKTHLLACQKVKNSSVES